MNDVSTGQRFEKLVEIVRRLRDPNGGCPWDLKQSHESLLQYLIEEAYEYIDAVRSEREKMPDELGDVLLQVVLHSQIGRESKQFSIDTVIDAISKKMVDRHPHVFGDTKVKDAEEVLRQWERNKSKKLVEGKSTLDGVPRMLPALQRAQRVSEKAARIGFEWNNVEEVRDKVSEELQEFLAECLAPQVSDDKRKDELGDIFFALVQLARRMGYESEDLLRQSTDKFVRRFKRMEELAGMALDSLTLERMDELWEKAKREEKNSALPADTQS